MQSDRTKPLRCSILFAGDATDSWLDYVRESDGLGFHGLGIGDSPSIYDDIYMRAMMAASCTKSMRIGPLVTNPLLRHPVVTAGAISTLERVIPGRTFLAIGAGDSAAANAGLMHGKIALLEDYAKAVKALLTLGVTTWNGATVKLALKNPAIPVYVAAAGPKTLQMAGRIADGVIVGTGVSPEAIALALSRIGQGARESGRNIEDLDIWFLVHASLSENAADARSAIVNTLITKVHATYKSEAALRTMPSHLHDAARDVLERYDALHHADFGFEGHKKLAEQHPELMDYIAHRHTITGEPESFIKRLSEIHALGARNLWIHPRTAFKKDFLRLWSRHLSGLRWIEKAANN